MFDKQKYSKIIKWIEEHQNKIELTVKKRRIFNRHKNEYKKLSISLNILNRHKIIILKS